MVFKNVRTRNCLASHRIGSTGMKTFFAPITDAIRVGFAIRANRGLITSGVLRVSRAWEQTQFWRPAQPVHGSIDAKNELAIKGRRKLTRALQSPAYCCF